MSELSDLRPPGFVRALMRSLVPIACPETLATEPVVDRTMVGAERYMRTLPLPVQLALIAGLSAYDLAAAAVPGHGGARASRLPRDRARAYWDWWAKGPVGLTRLFAYGVKGVLAGSFFEQPEVRAALGYTPDEWIDRVTRKRLAVYGDDISRHEASLFERDPLPLRDGTHAPAPARVGSTPRSAA